MDAAKEVTATFNAGHHTLSITTGGTGNGTVTSDPPGIDCPSDCSEHYATGTVVTITATGAPGSHFSGWLDAFCPAQFNPCVLTMDSNMLEKAHFTVNAVAPTPTPTPTPPPGPTPVPGPGAGGLLVLALVLVAGVIVAGDRAARGSARTSS